MLTPEDLAQIRAIVERPMEAADRRADLTAETLRTLDTRFAALSRWTLQAERDTPH